MPSVGILSSKVAPANSGSLPCCILFRKSPVKKKQLSWKRDRSHTYNNAQTNYVWYITSIYTVIYKNFTIFVPMSLLYILYITPYLFSLNIYILELRPRQWDLNPTILQVTSSVVMKTSERLKVGYAASENNRLLSAYSWLANTAKVKPIYFLSFINTKWILIDMYVYLQIVNRKSSLAFINTSKVIYC